MRRLLVGGDHVVVFAQRLAVPAAGVEIEDAAGFGLEVGVAGKIHERCRHGRMASSDSHRQIVVPEISATMPRPITSVAMSGTCRRDSGTPRRRRQFARQGLDGDDDLRGKDRWPPAPWALIESGQARLEESFAPLRHDLTACVERSAISSLSSPSAAMSTILARTTSRYGNVYLRARASSSCAARRSTPARTGSSWSSAPLLEGSPHVTGAPVT